jgi:antitoxin component of MazEF toxin-antitoxin module
MLRKIFKTGHSAAVTLSQELLKEMGLKVGDAVKVDMDNSGEKIIITAGKKQNQLPLGLRLRPSLKKS